MDILDILYILETYLHPTAESRGGRIKGMWRTVDDINYATLKATLPIQLLFQQA